MASASCPLVLVTAFLSAAMGLGSGLRAAPFFRRADKPRDPLRVRLDPGEPYLILATDKAGAVYGDAVAAAKGLHPGAAAGTFSPDDLEGARKLLSAHRPRYLLLFILPGELDVNFAWRWLTLCTRTGDGPLVGDPALIVTDAFAAPPFKVVVAESGVGGNGDGDGKDALRVTATLSPGRGGDRRVGGGAVSRGGSGG